MRINESDGDLSAHSRRINSGDPGPVVEKAHIRTPKKRKLVLIISVLAILVLLAGAAVVMPWGDIRKTLATTDMRWMTLALIANLAVFPFWVWQWQLLARPLQKVRWAVMARVVALSIGARTTISGLGGVASGAVALHGHAGLTPSGAGSVMSVDQLLAGSTKVAVLLLALLLAPLPASVQTGIATSALVFGGLGAGLVLLLHFRRLVAPGRWQPSLARRVSAWFAALADDLKQVGSLPVLLPTAVLALVKKSFEIAAIYAIQMALGIDGSLDMAILIVFSVSIVSLLPVAPVQLGPQAFAVFSTYAMLGVPSAQAVSAGLLHQLLVLVSTALITLTAFSPARRARRARRSA